MSDPILSHTRPTEAAHLDTLHKDHWLEMNWPWLVILFGALFITLILSFAPTT